ncbi:hypothetical protein Tco_1507533 [Tanacetum coccineum]
MRKFPKVENYWRIILSVEFFKELKEMLPDEAGKESDETEVYSATFESMPFRTATWLILPEIKLIERVKHKVTDNGIEIMALGVGLRFLNFFNDPRIIREKSIAANWGHMEKLGPDVGGLENELYKLVCKVEEVKAI